jgi:hypothetical protein
MTTAQAAVAQIEAKQIGVGRLVEGPPRTARATAFRTAACGFTSATACAPVPDGGHRYGADLRGLAVEDAALRQ